MFWLEKHFREERRKKKKKDFARRNNFPQIKSLGIDCRGTSEDEHRAWKSWNVSFS